MPTDPMLDAGREKRTPLWLLIPVGIALIVLGGMAFSVAFLIVGIIEGLVAMFRTLLVMIYLLIRFPAAALQQSREQHQQ